MLGPARVSDLESRMAEPEAECPDPLERIRRAERAQRLKTIYATFLAITVGQVLFGAFVFGHSQGPIRPQAAEVGAGMIATLLVSLAVAPWLAHRKRREGTVWAGSVHEGSHRRPLMIYDDVAILGGEVVLYDLVERCELGPDDATLHLRYLDPEHGGPVVRDLSGPPEALRRVARRAERQTEGRNPPPSSSEPDTSEIQTA